MKISKVKVEYRTLLVNHIIYIEWLLETILKKVKCIAIKGHDTPGDNDCKYYKIKAPTNEWTT